MHTIDGPEYPSIAHTDIKPGQFIEIDGKYKLNDFNRCRFMRWDPKLDSICGYKVGNNPGVFRAPEEYRYDVQDEKVDVYSLGNSLYVILTKMWVFEGKKKSYKAKEKIKAGVRPTIPTSIKESRHPADAAILKAIERSWVDPPAERASAQEIVDILKDAMNEMEALQTDDKSISADAEDNGKIDNDADAAADSNEYDDPLPKKQQS